MVVRKLQLLIFALFISISSFSATYPDFTTLIENVKPSVVVINSTFDSEIRSRAGTSFGSGFIIDDEGYILTNRHVIFHSIGLDSIEDQKANFVKVKLINGKEFSATIIGSDIGTDLALLKIDGKNLKSVKLGSVERLKVGEWVLAFGAPLGLEQTITAGIVSAKNRSLPGAEQYVPFLQTDAAINFGNSGGPLFNINGEVIGINSRIKSLSQGNIGLAFAIPIDLGIHVASHLKTFGSVQRGYLGVGYQEVDYDLAQNFGLSDVKGAIITAVTENSPAKVQGLQLSDIVLKVDGKEVWKKIDFSYMVGLKKPEENVVLELLREKKVISKTLVLGKRAEEPNDSPENVESNGLKLGLSVSNLPESLKEIVNFDHGIVVQRVYSGPSSRAGIIESDIILRVDNEKVTSVMGFKDLIDARKDQKSIAFLVFRQGSGNLYIGVNLE